MAYKFTVTLQDEDLDKAAEALYKDFSIDDGFVTSTQLGKAIIQFFCEEVDAMASNASDYFSNRNWDRLKDSLKVVQEREANNWLNANSAVANRVAPPGGWKDRWTEITTKDGQKFQGFDTFRAYEKMLEATKAPEFVAWQTEMLAEFEEDEPAPAPAAATGTWHESHEDMLANSTDPIEPANENY